MAGAAALTLGYRKQDKGTHCGILYESEDGSLKMLHFASHRRLLSESTWQGYMQIPSRVLPAQIFAISDICRLVYKKHAGSLMYSARKAQYFSHDGSLIETAVGAGFTCSNFVAELFRTRGCALVDLTTWPEANAKDRTFFAGLFSSFRLRFPFDRAHFSAAEDPDCRWSRLLPEHLGAAMTKAPPAAQYEALRNPAKALKANLLAAYPAIDQGVRN